LRAGGRGGGRGGGCMRKPRHRAICWPGAILDELLEYAGAVTSASGFFCVSGPVDRPGRLEGPPGAGHGGGHDESWGLPRGVDSDGALLLETKEMPANDLLSGEASLRLSVGDAVTLLKTLVVCLVLANVCYFLWERGYRQIARQRRWQRPRPRR